MKKKCYLVRDSWELGKIEECEIIKETEKTFVISWGSWGKNTIKKSEMSCYWGDIRLTYQEAISRLKERIKLRISIAENKIEASKKEIVSLTEKLKKVESEETGE